VGESPRTLSRTCSCPDIGDVVDVLPYDVPHSE
jgi:hypothetical protein